MRDLIGNLRWVGLTVFLLLSACGGGQASAEPTVDPEAIFTQTAMAASPTPAETATPTTTQSSSNATPIGEVTFTPMPTISALQTPTSSGPVGAICDDSAFVDDITIPDGTKLEPGEQFQKIWRIRNTGVCTWDGNYELAFAFGDWMQGQNFIITRTQDFVAPGQVGDLGVWLVAPTEPGQYVGHWRMKNDIGFWFGTYLTVVIVVEP
jgi:hypothetical protein